MTLELIGSDGVSYIISNTITNSGKATVSVDKDMNGITLKIEDYYTVKLCTLNQGVCGVTTSRYYGIRG